MWFENLELQIANERKFEEKGLWFEAIFGRVQPTTAKSAKKAENHSKEEPINTTLGKAWIQSG